MKLFAKLSLGIVVATTVASFGVAQASQPVWRECHAQFEKEVKHGKTKRVWQEYYKSCSAQLAQGQAGPNGPAKHFGFGVQATPKAPTATKTFTLSAGPKLTYTPPPPKIPTLH